MLRWPLPAFYSSIVHGTLDYQRLSLEQKFFGGENLSTDSLEKKRKKEGAEVGN